MKFNSLKYFFVNIFSILWSVIIVYFGYKYDKTPIPNGRYCYTPDLKKNREKKEGDWSYYIKPCKYYVNLPQGRNGCKYLGFITDDDVFDDQCKSCSVNIEYDNTDKTSCLSCGETYGVEGHECSVLRFNIDVILTNQKYIKYYDVSKNVAEWVFNYHENDTIYVYSVDPFDGVEKLYLNKNKNKYTDLGF